LEYEINIFLKEYSIFFKMKNDTMVYNILQIVLLNIIIKKLFSNRIKKFYKTDKNMVKILKINKINFIKVYNFLLFYGKIYIL